MTSPITKDSLIPIGLVMTLLGAAISFGVMYQKVEEVRSDMSEVKTEVAKLNDKIDTIIIQRSVAKSP